MSIFDDITSDESDNIIDGRWIEWDHALIPNKPKWFRDMMRDLFEFLGHCMVCTSIDGCYFLLNKMPKQPQHDNCDCKKKSISASIVKTRATATLPIDKFIGYIFGEKGLKNGKQQLFSNWGYNINDSALL